MKKTILILASALMFTSVCAQIKMSPKDSAAYAIGADMGRSVRQLDTTMNPEIIAKGLMESYTGKGKFSEEDIAKAIQNFIASKQMEQQKEIDAELTEFAQAATRTMDSLEKLPGISKTKSGLLYKIEKMGGEKLPQEGDMVTVHYVLKTVEGAVLDSSYERGEPFNFHNVKGQMIEGFSEGVQLLGEGGKILLYVPPHLGYGEQAMGAIRPNQVLIFEVNLLGITPKK